MWAKLIVGYVFLMVFVLGAWNMLANFDKLRAWNGVRYMSNSLAELQSKLRRSCVYDVVAMVVGLAGIGVVAWDLLR